MLNNVERGVYMNHLSVTDESNLELMKLAKKRVSAKKLLMEHIAAYVLVNIFLVLIYFVTSGFSFGYFWPIWPIMGWGLGLALHGVSVVLTLSYITGTDKVTEEYNRLKQQNYETEVIDIRDDRSN
jgi:hypothetical protein